MRGHDKTFAKVWVDTEVRAFIKVFTVRACVRALYYQEINILRIASVSLFWEIFLG